MNKTGGRRKLFITTVVPVRQVEKALFSTCSSPCFGVKPLYNYGHWFLYTPEYTALLTGCNAECTYLFNGSAIL
jgi:hypothetical protein